MRTTFLASLVIGCLAFIIVGCNVGVVTEAQQQAKIKAMDDIAKQDPRYAEKRAHGQH